MIKTFKHIIKKTSIQEIDVQLVMDRDYGAIEHYRHLRFDDYNIIVIDNVIDIDSVIGNVIPNDTENELRVETIKGIITDENNVIVNFDIEEKFDINKLSDEELIQYIDNIKKNK